MTETLIPTSQDTPLLGRPLGDLCRRYSMDIRQIVEQLIQAGKLPLLLIENTEALRLEALWQAEHDKKTTLERAIAERALEERERRRLFDEGVALRERMRGSELDWRMSLKAVERESGVDRLPKVEARVQRDFEDHMAAIDAWADWKRKNEAMASAVLAHLAEAEVPDTRPGIERLLGYQKPGLNEFAT